MQNHRTQLGRIAVKAGLILWEKPWQNRRATRQTELAETYSGHLVSKRMGNRELVANEHYLMLTDEHFEMAARMSDKQAQKAAQYTPENTRKDGKALERGKTKIVDFAGITGDKRHLTIPGMAYLVPPRRFELLLPG